MPINSYLKLARFKPSQPLMMSSGTSKRPKTQQIKAIWTHFQGNSANDLADQKVNSKCAKCSHVTTCHVLTCHVLTCLHQNPWRKKSVKTPRSPSSKAKIFIRFLEWYTTLIEVADSVSNIVSLSDALLGAAGRKNRWLAIFSAGFSVHR